MNKIVKILYIDVRETISITFSKLNTKTKTKTFFKKKKTDFCRLEIKMFMLLNDTYNVYCT